MKITVENLKFQNLFHIKKWAISEGSHLLIEGPSGAGKTTLLHLLSGLFLAPDSQIQIGSHSLHKLSDDERSELRKSIFGLVFQKLSLLDHLTALENVMLGTSDISRAQGALQKLGLDSKVGTRTALLSLGEQQRVAVARVLAQQPQIILADEPTSSLDDESAQIVIQALLQAAQNKTLIVVSHDHRLRSAFRQQIAFGDLLK